MIQKKFAEQARGCSKSSKIRNSRHPAPKFRGVSGSDY